MRVALSGGGSAGHITPTLAVSDALRSRDKQIELLYLGQAGSMEERIVRAKGLNFAVVRAGKFRREFFASRVAQVLNAGTLGPNARDAVRTVAGVGDALRVLRRFRPDAVFIKGGFVGVPVGIAARLLGIPYVVHESDVVPGLANKLLARWATKIAVGFPVKHYRDWPADRLVQTGNPVRQEILRAHRLEGLAKFHLRDDLPVVLVTGGSQGSRQINDCLMAALPELLQFAQVIHVTGEGEYQRLQFEQRRQPKPEHTERYQAFAFLLAEMAPALAAADIIVGRAGVNSIVEAAVLGKPLVLIPNYEMAGHQVANAHLLSRAGAARVLGGRNLTPEKLVAELRHLVDDPAEQARLSQAVRAFARPDAAAALAELVWSVGEVRFIHRTKQKPNVEADSSEESA
ncbi:MAG TPA: undecaprenyldiphospho-muramoylpentapeptide beta-N-acetylglucosaminyltransferase [Candidatus Saccharimonadia bacterium]